MPTCEFIAMARECGYDGVELRTTQVPIVSGQVPMVSGQAPNDSNAPDVEKIGQALRSNGMRLTRLLTHNLDEARWESFRRYVDVAHALGAESVGVWVVSVEWTRKGCDYLAQFGLPLVLQTHTGKFIGTPEDCHKFHAEVGRENLLFMYDPSHFYANRKPYGADVVATFAGKIFCGGFQKYGVETDAAGKLRFFPLPWDSSNGVQFEPVIEGFRRIPQMRDGFITVIEPHAKGYDSRERALYFARHLKALLRK